MIIVDLIYNLSILISLSIVSGFIDKRWERITLKGKILQGLLFGITAIIGMLYPFILTEGIIFDGRSVVISLCALFFGPLAGAISAILAILFRMQLGGGGTLMGILVISSSFFIGYLFYNWRTKSPADWLSTGRLYLFGLIVHTTMMIFVLTLPSESILKTYQVITMTVMVAYPLVTLLIGKILKDQEDNTRFVKELSSSESLIRTTLYSIGDAVITTDKQGRVQHMNPVAEQLSGWKEREAKGNLLEKVFKIINEESRNKVENPVLRVLSEGMVVGLTNHNLLISKDGKEIPIADSGAPIKNESGEIVGVVLVFRDQTEERARQKTLEEKSRLLEAFFENTLTLIALLDKDFNFIRVNQAYACADERDVSKFPGYNHFEFYPSDAKVIFEEVVRTKKPYQTFARPFVYADHPEREVTYWDWTLVPILGKSGEVELLIFSLINVSERMRLEQTKERLTSILEATPDFVATANPNGQALYYNQAARRMLGIAENEDISNIHISDTHPEWANKIIFEEAIPTAISQGTWRGETALLSRDGCEIPVSQVVIAHKGTNGNIEFFSTIARDITEHKQAEETMRLQSAALTSAANTIVITDRHGIIQWVNPAFKMLSGYEPQEAIGRNPRILKSGIHDKIFYKELWETILSGQVWRGEIINRRKDSGLSSEEMTITPLRDKHGEISHFIAIKQDITKRKQAEESLRESEERFRTIAESSLTGIYLIQDQRFRYVNQSLAKIFGYEVEEIVDHLGPLDLTHPDDHSTVIENIRRRVSGEVEDIRYDFRGLCKDGSIIYVEVHGKRIDYRGKAGIIGTLVNITERKLAENALRESEERFRNIFETANEGICIVDENEIIINVNQKFSDMVGYAINELINKNFKILVLDYDLRDSMMKTRERREGKKGYYERRLRKKDGSIIWTFVSASPINDPEGKFIGSFALFTDITERKQMEEDLIAAKEKAEEASHLKDGFISAMSHEIRTPLNIILGYSGVIRDVFDPRNNEEYKRYFDSIEKAGLRLINTITQILDISRLETGEFPVSLHPISINDSLTSAVDQLKVLAKEKNIELKLNLTSENLLVVADNYCLEGILINVINNAIKYSNKGLIEITTSVDNDLVRCTVKDEGIGISEEYLKRLFEPFSQEEIGYSRTYEGTGLGLALTKRYLELMNGKISVKSTKGVGTTVEIFLPLAK